MLFEHHRSYRAHARTIPSYVVSFNVAATAAMDVLSVQPGSSGKVVRLRRIVLVNPGNATGAIVVDLSLGTATAFGSGGAVATAAIVDSAARPAGVTGGPDVMATASRAGDTSQAAGFSAVYSPLVSVAVPTVAAGFTPLTIYDSRDPGFKPLTVSGTGLIVLRTPSVGAGATGLRGYAEFTVDDA
jgi:hypothetical protein